MNDERDRCYELLGLAPGASAEELKAAHRDLVKVWHPDRFAHDPRLQQKAQEKLKEINEAYELLTSGRTPRRARPAPPESGYETATPARRYDTPAPPRRPARWPSVLLAAAVCCVVFFVASRTLWTRGGSAPVRATERTPAASAEAPTRRDDTPAANQPTQTRKRSEREDSDAPVKTDDPANGRDAAAARALPTVTVLTDPTTGLLATPACPVRSRTTYAAGNQPGRHCDAHRKESSNRAP